MFGLSLCPCPFQVNCFSVSYFPMFHKMQDVGTIYWPLVMHMRETRPGKVVPYELNNHTASHFSLTIFSLSTTSGDNQRLLPVHCSGVTSGITLGF